MSDQLPKYILKEAEREKHNIFINEAHTIEHERAFMEGVCWLYGFMHYDSSESSPEQEKPKQPGGEET